VLLSFEQSNLSHELNYLLKKSEKTTSQEYILKNHKTTLQHYEQIQKLKFELHQTSIEFEDFKVTYFDHIAQIERDQDILAKDLNVVHSRIHYLFNQIYNIYNIHHHFMLETINLYQLPAHPEDIKTFISLYLNIFKELSLLQT